MMYRIINHIERALSSLVQYSEKREEKILDFLQSTYLAGIELFKCDRSENENYPVLKTVVMTH